MVHHSFELKGNIVDVVARRIFRGTVVVHDGIISEIREEVVTADGYILPGLIDAHIHVESSMLIPSEFARLAVVHGTVGSVSDPHEIANVLGVPGVKFMIENGRKVPFKFYFGAPSCVPATPFETAGASLGVEEVRELLHMPEIKYLSEMMNFPGVLYRDPEVMAKLELAHQAGKPVDGHAPGVTGADAEKYIRAGISTDHECFSIREAHEKINYGMHILIREGSAAKNFDTLYPLIDEFPDQVMLCSDDKHPNDLVAGHINLEVKRAFSLGLNKMNVLRCCTYNPVKHYNLEIGLLQTGDPADFIQVDNRFQHPCNLCEWHPGC
jgi:adenine deaminase